MTTAAPVAPERQHTEVAVGILVRRADAALLLSTRPAGKPYAGFWEFPGGKIEPGETPEAALVRELDEELGVVVDHSCLAPAAFASEALGERHLLLLLYALRKWQGIPVARHATALQWLRPVQLHALAMPPADRPLIGLLEALV